MSLIVGLRGANGKAIQGVNGGALLTSSEGTPPQGLTQKSIIYRDFFKDVAGSEDLVVNGSVTPVEFTILAPEDSDTDRYISALSFELVDGSMTLGSNFGGLSPLTNGLNLEYTNSLAEGNIVSLDLNGINTNFDLVRLCLGNPPFGTGNDAFQAGGFPGNTSAFIPVLEFSKYGFPNGILLKGGTKQNITIRVNDDLTGISTFNCVASGLDVLKVD